MKLLKANSKMAAVLAVVLLAAGVASGIFVFKTSKPASRCGVEAVSAKTRATKNFYTPCELTVTVTDPASTTMPDIERIAEPIAGEVEKNDFSESGIYFINVPPGTEEKAVEYLKSQPEINSAARNHCCVTIN